VFDADPTVQSSLDMVWAVASFVFGAMVGSFLNVVIARLPAGDSVVSPRSRCPVCEKEIRSYDNIPLLSYLVLLGRCRDCGHRISIRYPVVEFITACLCLALYWKFGSTSEFGVFFVFCAALVAVFWIDIDHMIIPDVISLNGIIVGIIVSFTGFLPDITWEISAVGVLLGGAILYIPAVIYRKIRGIEGLGGGDIKLLAMIGAFTGPYGVVFVLFFSSLLGSFAALAGMVTKEAGSTTPIPFGPFLAGSAIFYVFAGPEIIVRFYMMSSGF
jgi:leader peptidase (prepilin peptidase) / N-methyltransferase